MRARHSRVAAALAVGVILLSTSCSAPTAVSVEPAAVAKAATGGTLHILRHGPVSVWDPQRLAVGADIAFAGRVFQRTLTAWAPATRQDRMPSLSADLATDTGTVGSAGKVWTFTLRRGVKWQDGRSVTCADVKYGVSRTFATASVTGGSTQALALLDVPHKADGTSTDRGVQPGVPATSDIFSNGPYQLRGVWLPGKGGTFDRNPHWDVRTDPIRKARPAELAYTDGVPVEDIVSRIMTNQRSDSLAVTAESTPQVLQNNIMANPSIRARSSNPLGQYVDYLLPNFNRPIMTRLKVRQALAMATSREAYVAGLGGDTAAVATHAMISQALPAYRAFNPLKVPTRGDSARARALLRASGLVLPVSVTVAYRRVDAAAKVPVASRRERAWADLDQELATRVAAIPLSNSRSVFVHGSGVVGYLDNPALFGTVDLATVAVR